METLIGEQAIGFGKPIKAHLDGEKEVKRKDEVRHRRRSGVPWPRWRRENTSLLQDGT